MSRPYVLFASFCALAAATIDARADDDSTLQVTARSELFPAGSIRWQTPVNGMTSATDFAYGAGASIEYRLSRVFSIGFAPRLILNVKAGGLVYDPGKELDLCARLSASWPVAQTVRLQAFSAPGYSLIFLPPFEMADGLRPRGLVLGVGGGVSVDLSHGLFLASEVGYQLGFQATTVRGPSAEPGPLARTPVDFQTNYLQISVSVGANL